MDAVSRVHGQPITFFAADWASPLVQFKQRHVLAIHDAKLPPQSLCDSFPAETLAHVVGMAEERKQSSSKPEPPRQMGVHLDASLKLVTRKRCMSVMTTNSESLHEVSCYV